MKIALILPRAGIYRFRTGAFSKFIRYSPMALPTLAPSDISVEIEIYDEVPFVLDDGSVAVCGYCPTATVARCIIRMNKTNILINIRLVKQVDIQLASNNQ
jgi:hypothetical protein